MKNKSKKEIATPVDDSFIKTLMQNTQTLITMSNTLTKLASKVDDIEKKVNPVRLGEKPVLNMEECVAFLNDECGFRTTVGTVYKYINYDERQSKSYSITRAIPYFKIGQKNAFHTHELRDWANEQIAYSQVATPS